MGFTRMKYTPETGLKDTSVFPATPASETTARDQFQRLFDQVKQQVNALMTALENVQNDVSGAQQIGTAPIEGVNGKTVYEMLSDLKSQINFEKIGDSLPTGCVGTDQLINGQVTMEKMSDNSVGTDQLTNDCVTEDKLAAGAVTTDKMGAVRTLYLDTSSVIDEPSQDEDYIEIHIADDENQNKLMFNLNGCTAVQLAPVVYGTAATVSGTYPPGTVYIQYV